MATDGREVPLVPTQHFYSLSTKETISNYAFEGFSKVGGERIWIRLRGHQVGDMLDTGGTVPYRTISTSW